jgi:lysyl-tRNA synthetase class I
MAAKAKESKQVEKARNKLKLQIQEEHQMVTENKLREVSQDIKNWISRHAPERVKLKQKDISLFDANQHPEKVHSRYIKNLLHDLAKPIPPKSENTLEGRVSF